MKNGIKIAVIGILQVALASQANAQLVIAPSQVALNLQPVPVVAVKDIVNMDLVAIQSVRVQEVTELGLEQLASLTADDKASDANEITVSMTVASAVIPVPPSNTPNSVNQINNNSSSTNSIVVATNNNNPVVNGTTGQIDKFGGSFPVSDINGDFYLRESGDSYATIVKSPDSISIAADSHLVDF